MSFPSAKGQAIRSSFLVVSMVWFLRERTRSSSNEVDIQISSISTIGLEGGTFEVKRSAR